MLLQRGTTNIPSEKRRCALNTNVLPVATATTRLLRMRVDLKPWTDNRVRQALKLCQNREKILALAYQNEGLQGQNFHVYPKHPEY